MKNVNICEAFCTSRPSPNETLEEPFTWRRGLKGYIFLRAVRGVEGWTGLSLPFRMLSWNQALMFIFSFIKEPGARGEWRGRTNFAPKSVRWWIPGVGKMSALCGQEEKPEELEKMLFNKSLL